MHFSKNTLSIFAWIAFMPATAAVGQTCSHPLDPKFYETQGYKVGTIQMVSPFDFIFLVRQRFNLIKVRLALQEGTPFTADEYNQSFKTVEDAVRKDGTLGSELPAKVAVVTGGLANCNETAGSQAVDVLYRIFSTDPIPAVVASPDERQKTVSNQATEIAQQTTIPTFKVVPRVSYDRTSRAFGGLDFAYRLPGMAFNSIEMSALGSSSERSFKGQASGALNSGKTILDRGEYGLAYSFHDEPALNLRLAKGTVEARFQGTSKPLETNVARIAWRYGVAVEQGNQQSNLLSLALPFNTIANSEYGAVKLYVGMTATTRHSETAVSYGFQRGGAGLSSLGYTKQIGDVLFGARFPGGTHRPWDVSVRATVGVITGSGPILINDRFFGGNSVSPFILGDSWTIPNGPLLRSIPANRLVGTGFGGTSFYSGGLTVGKVIFGSPIVPDEVEQAAGFASGVSAAENSAENWFADDYEASSAEFKKLLTDFPSRLKSDLDAAQAEFQTIRAAGSVGEPLDTVLRAAEREARLAQNMIGHASDPGRGPDNANKLRAWLLPASRFRNLATDIQTIEPLVPSATARQLDSSKNAILGHLSDLDAAMTAIHAGPVRAAAERQAAQDMVRPREVIDTLRHEANSYAFSLVALTDLGRLWPDPYGTRYAFGGGGRVSLVNVNFTLGYAVNPSPHRELGQGRGAVFFSITYTNLFN
jgi:hypothetical protein